VVGLGIVLITYLLWNPWEHTNALIAERKYIECVLDHASTIEQLHGAEEACSKPL
jgi:hypothetical protein